MRGCGCGLKFSGGKRSASAKSHAKGAAKTRRNARKASKKSKRATRKH